jgi:hypothetical protein
MMPSLFVCKNDMHFKLALTPISAAYKTSACNTQQLRYRHDGNQLHFNVQLVELHLISSALYTSSIADSTAAADNFASSSSATGVIVSASSITTVTSSTVTRIVVTHLNCTFATRLTLYRHALREKQFHKKACQMLL